MRTTLILLPLSLLLACCGNSNKNNKASDIKGCNYITSYFPNKNVQEEGCRVNGKREGTWKQYVQEGWQRFEWTYHNDKLDGQYKSFYEDGKLNSVGHYKNDALADTTKFYEKNGDLYQLEVWKPTGENESSQIYLECFGDGKKPDGAIQFIDGKKYLWMNGTKKEAL